MKEVLSIILLVFIGYGNLYACSCKRKKTVQESYKYHESILYGKVLTKTLVSRADTMNEIKLDSLKKLYKGEKQKLKRLNYKSILKVEVEIIKEFKGKSISDTVTIFTHSRSSACGYTRFEIGKEYLIYSSSKSYVYYNFQRRGKYINYELENTFWTSHCYRTKDYIESEAQEISMLMK